MDMTFIRLVESSKLVLGGFILKNHDNLDLYCYSYFYALTHSIMDALGRAFSWRYWKIFSTIR